MKCLIFFFIGCIVFATAQTYPNDKIEFRSSVGNKVSELIDDFIKSVSTPFVAAAAKIRDILTKSYIKINESIQKSMVSLTSITDHLHTTIESIKKQNGHAKECGEKYENELNLTKTNVQNELHSCATNFIKQIKEQQNIVKNDFNNIDDSIEEFRLSAVTCIHFNPFTTTKCVFNRISKYRQIIGDIGSKFKQTINDVTLNAAKIPKGLFECNRDVVKNAVLEFDKILKNVNKCAKETIQN